MVTQIVPPTQTLSAAALVGQSLSATTIHLEITLVKNLTTLELVLILALLPVLPTPAVLLLLLVEHLFPALVLLDPIVMVILVLPALPLVLPVSVV